MSDPTADPQLKPLILASASPRRAALLQMLGFRFSIEPSHVSEELGGDAGPRDHVSIISRSKAEAVASGHTSGIVIGADTVVVLDGDILGKPVDADDAAAMLRRLSGQTHEVITGVTLIDAADGQTQTDAEVTKVRFRSLSDDEIRRYADTDEPLDKAGAYAAQGRAAVFIESVLGCYYNVVGLPLTLFWQQLEKMIGHSPWDQVTPSPAGADLVSRSADIR